MEMQVFLTAMQTVKQARTKEQLIFQVRRQGPRHQMCCGDVQLYSEFQCCVKVH